MRYKIVFSYDGTNYLGYAKQPTDKKESIQGTIEKALNTIFNEEITIYASGRTDKNVHAINQVADFVTSKNIDVTELKNTLNSLIPDDINIKNCEIVPDDFSSRFNAISKTYIYIISPMELNLFYEKYVYFDSRIDIEKMKSALPLFIGTHDFKNFTSKPEDQDNFIRTINYFNLKRAGDFYIFEINGNGFMRYMVRKIVGTILEIGKGKLDTSFITKNLSSKSRDIVTYTAYPHALFLLDVQY